MKLLRSRIRLISLGLILVLLLSVLWCSRVLWAPDLRPSDVLDAVLPLSSVSPDASAPGAESESGKPEALAPGADKSSPGSETVSPGAESSSPGQDISAPGAESSSPGQDVSVPGAEIPSVLLQNLFVRDTGGNLPSDTETAIPSASPSPSSDSLFDTTGL